MTPEAQRIALAVPLKPCPFCGCEYPIIHNDAATKPEAQTHVSYWVYCTACAAEGPWGDPPEEAAEKWNTRHDPQPALTEHEHNKFPKGRY